jgi:Tfp pilus assembly protein FimT
LELVTIIAILGLTMTYAVPGLRTTVTNNRISGNANDFIAAQQFSKAESASCINPAAMRRKNVAGNACFARPTMFATR